MSSRNRAPGRHKSLEPELANWWSPARRRGGAGSDRSMLGGTLHDLQIPGEAGEAHSNVPRAADYPDKQVRRSFPAEGCCSLVLVGLEGTVYVIPRGLMVGVAVWHRCTSDAGWDCKGWCPQGPLVPWGQRLLWVLPGAGSGSSEG